MVRKTEAQKICRKNAGEAETTTSRRRNEGMGAVVLSLGGARVSDKGSRD